jgi:methylphosphotriester-DNA--protein-cysteine methyltransferase
MIRLF